MTTSGPLQGGTVFQLTAASGGTWRLSTLHAFADGMDGGCIPGGCGEVSFDNFGRLYGTTSGYGAHNDGVAFNLGPVSPFSWYELILHAFAGGSRDGSVPTRPLTFDASGDAYGTTFSGGTNDAGTVFQLTPNKQSFGWTEKVLYSFQGTPYGSATDGANPFFGVILDAAGNLYGATAYGGPSGAGTVFKLSPNQDGTWTESVIYALKDEPDGAWPTRPTFDKATGNLYGTTYRGGAFGQGSVYKLAPSLGGQWTETILYSFIGLNDGGPPADGVILDSIGNLYGTTSEGGAGGPEFGGVVWEITP
jgi:uncharacterized repeat protein (TIGR03803 family)